MDRIVDTPMDIPMKPVVSSNLARVGYDESTQTLAVRFKTGAAPLYWYHGVPPSQYNALCCAVSAGQFLHVYIKPAYPVSQPIKQAESGTPLLQQVE